MSQVFSAIGVIIALQLFDYLSMTSYSQLLGYNYKYLPLSFRREVCLVAVSACFTSSIYFSDANNPPIGIVAFASLPIALYIYFTIKDLYACKPRDDTQRIDE